MVPPLVRHGLTHKDKAVQVASMETLEKITGRGFGLKPEHTDAEREEAIRKWVAAWEAEVEKAENAPEARQPAPPANP